MFHLFLDEEDSHSSLQEVTITTPQISSLTTRSVCARNDKSCDIKKARGDNIHEECEMNNGDQFVKIIREEVVEIHESNSTGTHTEAMSLKEHSPVCSCIDSIASFLLGLKKK